MWKLRNGRGKARVLAAVAVGFISPACSSGYHGACSLVGGSDGVEVRFDQVTLPRAAALVLRGCVDGRCHTAIYHGLNPDSVAQHGLFVEVPHMPVDSSAEISIRLTANSHQLFAGSTTAHTQKVQPNGPDCDPTVWHARVIAHDKTQLTS
jgi:hypothetical protein